MLRKILYKLSGKLPIRFISREGERYLERYYVATVFGYRIYLHRFVDGDGDEEVHNHPWDSWSFCLAGGYEEGRMTNLCTRNGVVTKTRHMFPGRLSRIRSGDFHIIRSSKPETWTVFVHNTRQYLGWGFLKVERDEDAQDLTQKKVVFRQIFPTTKGKKWWRKNPVGNKTDRAPLYYEAGEQGNEG